MKKVYVICALLALLLSGSTVYAQNRGEGLKSQKIEITDENRYDPVYFQEPEEIYPISSAEPGRARAGSEVAIEEYIVNALENFQERIDISSYGISADKALETFIQVLNNNPQLFYIRGNGATVWSENDIASYYEVEYSDTIDNIKIWKEKFEQEVDKLIDQLDNSLTDLEKALVIHDQIVLNCEYDYQNYLDKNIPADSFTAYGALVNGTAVCQGYAEAYDYIMENRLGIPCHVVSSDSMNHAWNMILIDGSWYHVDVTWDDPTWDSVGRVAHTYFMLSDAAISDSTRNHTGWGADYTASSDLYDNGFWSDIRSGIFYHEGAWYYSRFQSADWKVSLVKKNVLLGGEESSLYGTSPVEWNNYPDSYMFLAEAGGDIYFNTGTCIYKLQQTEAVQVFNPSISGDNRIFGFTIKDGELRYALQETPNLTGKQQIFTYKLEIPELTGIGAENVTGVYDGKRKEIQITGTEQGDKILFMGGNGAYGTVQPEMIQAGIYQVQYKVERKGYMPYYGSATVDIAKADPVYEIPSGLTGASGNTLGDVRLPSGFFWESDSSTVLTKEGTYTYSVKYIPEDGANYKEISGIEVKVTVKCPGHQYSEETVLEPTETEEGERIFTCIYCGDTYREKIGALGLKAPGKVSGLKVSKYSANTLQFSWKKAEDTSYELILYKGSRIVNRNEVKGSSCTYKNLQGATVYTLEIRPFREIGGDRVYASASSKIMTATAPGRPVLSSVKKSGSKNGSLKWKKVPGASGYEVYMRTGKGAFRKVRTVTGGNRTAYIQKGLGKGKTYTFRIRAYKAVGRKKVWGSYGTSKTLRIRR